MFREIAISSFSSKMNQLLPNTILHEDRSEKSTDDNAIASKLIIRKNILQLFNAIKASDETFCPDQQLIIDDNLSIQQIWAQLRPSIDHVSIDVKSKMTKLNHDDNSVMKPTDGKNEKSDDEIYDSDIREPSEPRCNENFSSDDSMMKLDKPKKGEFFIEENDRSTKAAGSSSIALHEQEAEMLAKKPWNLKGEATARQRDRDSLLEHEFQIDYALKTVPEPSEDFTKNLEELIKERIKNQSFNDPQRKHQFSSPNDILRSSKSTDAIEKSRKSLTELYENTLKTIDSDATCSVVDQKESQESQDELKCLRMWRELLGYLESLSSCTAAYNPFIENLREQSSGKKRDS